MQTKNGRLKAKGVVFGGVTAETKKGKGRFSNVWQCEESICDLTNRADTAAAAATTDGVPGLTSASALGGDKSQRPAQPIAVKAFRCMSSAFTAFRYEMIIMKHLSKHPRAGEFVTTLIDSGVFYNPECVGVHCWYTMPMEQSNLKTLIRNTLKIDKTSISIPVALAIARSLFKALQFIHSENVIHCDLKPANILIKFGCDMTSEDIEVKLADFGASIIVTGDDDGGRGTVTYASPEMLSEDSTITPATDIWSAGATLYQIITGEHLIDPDDPTFSSYDLVTVDELDGDDADELCDEIAALDVADDGSSASDDADSDDDETPSSECNNDITERNTMYIFEKLFGKPPASVRKMFDFYSNNGRIKEYEHISGDPPTEISIIEYPVQRVEIIDLLMRRHALHTIISEAKTREIAAFIVNCMRYKPEDRITASAALECSALLA